MTNQCHGNGFRAIRRRTRSARPNVQAQALDVPQRATCQTGSAVSGDVVAFLRQNMSSWRLVDDMEVLTGFNPTTQSEFWALSLDTPPSPLPIRVLSCAAPPPHHVRSGNFLYHHHCIPSPRLSPLDVMMGTATTPKPAAAVQDRCHVVHALGGGTAAGGHRRASLPAPFYLSTALGPAARGCSLVFCPFRASGPGCSSEIQPALAHPSVLSCG